MFLTLVDRADVVITNFKPGTMESWGLGYDEVAARNRLVVYAAGSTYGTVGPDATREGADLAGQAAGMARPVSATRQRPASLSSTEARSARPGPIR